MEESQGRSMSPFLSAEQSDCIREVARIMHTAPAFVADPFGASPERIEKLLRARGQWNDSLSIRENVEAHYGTTAVRAIEAAI